MLLPNYGDVVLVATLADPMAKASLRDGAIYINSPIASKLEFPGLVKEVLPNGVVRFRYPELRLGVVRGQMVLVSENFFYPL
jgi:hypothetical protein